MLRESARQRRFGILFRTAFRNAGLTEVAAEKGLDYPCGSSGCALSGGQKQRIGIARSILRGASVLMIDEATSSPDDENSRRIMETVLTMRNTTRILITHDIYPDLLAQFDGVFELKDGRIENVRFSPPSE